MEDGNLCNLYEAKDEYDEDDDYDDDYEDGWDDEDYDEEEEWDDYNDGEWAEEDDYWFKIRWYCNEKKRMENCSYLVIIPR